MNVLLIMYLEVHRWSNKRLANASLLKFISGQIDVVVVVDRFYIALFSALGQIH